MTITPFRYPGAKNKLLPILLPYIDKLLLNQGNFIDAFVGGGSVLLEIAQKYPKINLYANDKDYWIYCFWSILSETNNHNLNQLLDLMKQTPIIELFYKLREKETKDKVECAYKAIFFNRCCFSGIAKSGPIGGEKQLSKYKIDCRYNYEKLSYKILQCHKLLSGRTVVTNCDFSNYEILNKNYPIYFDPPYYKAGNSLYIETMKIEDHEKLSKILSEKNNWILSYDDCEEIKKLYYKNKIINIDAKYCIDGKKENWKSKEELIILAKNL